MCLYVINSLEEGNKTMVVILMDMWKWESVRRERRLGHVRGTSWFNFAAVRKMC